MSAWSLRGDISGRAKTNIFVFGTMGFLALWLAISHSGWLNQRILPTPERVIGSFPELHFEYALVRNLGHSIMLNCLGYLEAVAVAVPLGFAIGLFAPIRALFDKPIAATRFLPLPAAMGLFIAWFGISTNMKVQFLAVGIIVYLLPVVVQRIADVDNVYPDTAKTLGANRWQRITKVYWPAVMSKLSDDIRVLIAISWTYIIIAEDVNKGEGGIGALISTVQRASRTDMVFAGLLSIILVGFIQDQILLFGDRRLYPYKYV